MVNLNSFKTSNLLKKATTRQIGIFKGAAEVGLKGTLWSLPFVAMDIANGERGEKLSQGLAAGASQLKVSPALTYASYIAVATIIPGIGTGMLALGMASLLVHYPSELAEKGLNRAFREFRSIDKNINRLNMGYQDTSNAMSYRQNAMRDLSGAFASSRRYLGNEAIFSHR